MVIRKNFRRKPYFENNNFCNFLAKMDPVTLNKCSSDNVSTGEVSEETRVKEILNIVCFLLSLMLKTLGHKMWRSISWF